MHTDHLSPDSERLARCLERDPNFRVLREVPKPFSTMPQQGAPPEGRCIAIVDLETTGLNPSEDAIIEIAILLAFVDEDGAVLGHFGPLSWTEDPEVPLLPEITMLTGLTSQALGGTTIPDKQVLGLLSRADLLVSHNAAFEMSFLERRYPDLRGKAWACSCKDIPWLKLGLDGRGQGHLLMQHGWTSTAHRAGPDTWALFVLLSEARTGWLKGLARTHLQRLLAAADRATTIVEARGAPYSKKDALRARGYRWNARDKFWEKELEPHQVEHEEAWFYRTGLPAPRLRAITAHERHR